MNEMSETLGGLAQLSRAAQWFYHQLWVEKGPIYFEHQNITFQKIELFCSHDELGRQSFVII